MEIVVLNSDIARLVLDYLKSQKLKRATHTFCKTSPYLKQEFCAYKQGLQTHSFFPELKEIICEYVKISRKVEQLLPKLSNALRSQCQQGKLSDKISQIIDYAINIILSQQSERSTATAPKPNDSEVLTSLSTGPQTSGSINSDKENNNIKVVSSNKKRKRSFTGNLSSNDEQSGETNKARLKHSAKKLRVLEPFCFLSSKALQRHRRRHRLRPLTYTTDDLGVENAEQDEDRTNSSNEDESETETGDDEMDAEYDENDAHVVESEKPTKESTPRNKSEEAVDARRAPILPEISQAILENPEFQQKLVENINQALTFSTGFKVDPKPILISSQNIQNTTENTNQITDDASGISSSQLLDQMVKNILDVTEKDPSFDAIIHEVVEAAHKPLVQSTAVQCDFAEPVIRAGNTMMQAEVQTVQGNNKFYTITEPPPVVHSKLKYILPAQPPQIPPPQQQLIQTAEIVNTVESQHPPRTPLIIRTAVAAANNSVLGTAQDSPNLDANNTFGSLIDPNFSISKLIVLNSNDSAQKQHPEAGIGNTTAENIISQLSGEEFVPSDDQVYYDPSSGQLTFPVFLTSDGLLANLPFLVNNEVVTQQLQSNNFCNLETSRIEIPLAEPIKITADQLPPNSIILGSNQKLNNIETIDAQQSAEKQAGEANKQKDFSKTGCCTGPPASLDSKMLTDKSTPSASGIINTKAYKSLSTPRKRTSHVRALTFSPRGPPIGTPLSTRISRFQRPLHKTIAEVNKENPDDSNGASEKPIIKNVEILPSLPTANETLKVNNSVAENESTNSGNIPPLFVIEDNSNQTVINKNIQDIKYATKDAGDATPKSGQERRKSAARSCKRQLTKTQMDEDLQKEKSEKENEVKVPTPGTEEYKKYMMEQWKLQKMSTSSPYFDVHLRELNAKMNQMQPIKKVNTKKRSRRKKPAATKRKEKELAEEAEELEISRELEEENNKNKEKQIASYTENEAREESQKAETETDNNDEEKSLEFRAEKQNETKTEKKKKTKEIIIKIPTPQKNASEIINDKVKNKKGKVKENKKDMTELQVDTNKVNNNKVESADKKSEEHQNLQKSPVFQMPVGEAPHQLATYVNEALEREKRTSNIAFLLDTPFKDASLSSCMPPTPGIFAPTLETPVGKNRDPHDDMHASASFLFGSLTKSELDTPMLNAITPGFRFTPFGLKDAATPRSGAGTDCSSGAGSYYKPDESEDLDRNIDKMIRDSAQKRQHEEGAEDTDKAPHGEDFEEGEIQSEKGDLEGVEVEFAVETLKVEPIVLKRIKSFGSEAVDSVETVKIDPHYTLISGLPEIVAAEDEESSSSSSSSSSSASSSSSSSNSSKSSSSSSDSHSSTKSTTVQEAKTPSIANLNELENLSEISSTEDEEWQRLAVTDNDENSQLVNNDGEVRYPVRSWLTPIKENVIIETPTKGIENSHNQQPPPQATIRVTLPLKSAEKRNRQLKELEQKRERLKEKLKSDETSIAKKDKPATSSVIAPNISQALAATKLLHAMRDKGKNATLSNAIPQTDDKRSIDVLTALHLSAKKQLPKTPESDNSKNQSKLTQLAEEDNVTTPKIDHMSHIAKTPECKENPRVNVSSASHKTPLRKCLPIEARPAKTIRKTNKKIVRTPLAFKTTQSPGKSNTSKALELTTSPLVQSQAVRVSPRLMEPKKTRAKKVPDSSTNKTRVTTRTTTSRSRNAKKKESPKKVKNTKKNPIKDKGEEEKSKEESKPAMTTVTEEQPTESTSSTPVIIKPKIHLKAGKVMTSNKGRNKTNKEEETEIDQIIEINEIRNEKNKNDELKEDKILKTVTSPSRNAEETETVALETVPSAAESPESLAEDISVEEWDMSTIDETDTRRFICYNYQGPEQPIPMSQSLPPLSEFQMVVSIDEIQKVQWRASEGICLYTSEPTNSAPKLETKQIAVQHQPTRTIPKKRKVRVTSSSLDDKSEKQKATPLPITPLATNVNTKIAAASLKAFTTAANPGATSTPVTQQQTATNRTDKEGSQKPSSEPVNNQTPAETSLKPNEELTKSEVPKIQIEDIESILSHLHGT